MKRQPNVIADFFRNYPFGVLLLAIMVMIVGAPLTGEVSHHIPGGSGADGLTPLTLMLTTAAAYAVWNHGSRRRAIGICIVGGILATLGIVSLITDRQRVPDFAHLCSQTIFLVYVTGSILRVVFQARVVNGNVLCGAACVYLLAGALCGYAFAMLEIVNHDSFTLTAPDMAGKVDLYDEPGWLIYFSYTTLTTVGFGDVLPSSSVARSLAVLEAVIGQIMLVVMMARLVGLHVAHSTSSPGKFEMTSNEDE
jgi:hypothetical protein